MKYAVLSDIHANLEALRAVMDDLRRQDCTKVVCLGDIVGYGANPRECLELIRGLNLPTVQGDHDRYAATEHTLDHFRVEAARVVKWTRAQLNADDRSWLSELKLQLQVADFTMVHASLNDPERWEYVFEKHSATWGFVHQRTPICFFGHTHVPIAFVQDTGGVQSGNYSRIQIEAGKRYLVNVGSVGQPRDGIPLAGYVVYDSKAKTMDLRRVEYPVAEAQRKIRMRDGGP